MPRTIEQVASEALLNVASDAGLSTAVNFLSQRYRKLAARVRFRHLRRRAEIRMPAEVRTGVATFVGGATLVQLDVEARAAVEAAGDLRGRFIAPSSGQPWVEVRGLEVEGLRLATPYAGADTSGGYRLVARYHRLAPDTRWLGAVTLPRLNVALTLSSETELAQYSSGRMVVGGGWPTYYCLAPPDFDGRPRIEVYPPAGLVEEILSYTYYAEPAMLGYTDQVPPGLSEDVLREGVMIDLLRLEWVKAVRGRDYEGAAHYRNEYNTLLTRWERDAYAMAGDVDTVVSDDFIAVRGADRVEDEWPHGLWPADRL